MGSELRSLRTDVVAPPWWLSALVAAGAAVALWGLTGWSWIAPAAALGVALLVRIFGFLLPRQLRARVGVIAVVGALVAMLVLSTGWAIAAVTGFGLLPLALVQRGRVRLVAALVAGAVALTGVVGLAVEAGIKRARYADDLRIAGDYSRAKMLPQRPSQAMSELIALTAKDPGRTCYLFNEAGQAAFARAWDAPTCPDAARVAHSRVTDPRLFREGLAEGAITVAPPGPAGVDVDGCHLKWTTSRLGDLLNGEPAIRPVPGPQMGVITVVPTGMGFGWIASDFRRC